MRAFIDDIVEYFKHNDYCFFHHISSEDQRELAKRYYNSLTLNDQCDYLIECEQFDRFVSNFVNCRIHMLGKLEEMDLLYESLLSSLYPCVMKEVDDYIMCLCNHDQELSKKLCVE